MLKKDKKAMLPWTSSDNGFFDIVFQVLHVNTIASFLFIICVYYAQQTSIDQIRRNGFTLKKRR